MLKVKGLEILNEIISKALKPGFELKLYAAARQNLADTENPLRLNNFAYAMRELVRHMLDRLAPSKSVLACSWYKNEANRPEGITRRQRAYYAVQGGLSDEYVELTLGLRAHEIHQALIKAIDGLSKLTHIQPNTFDISDNQVDALTEKTELAVADLLETIAACRKKIADALWGQIDEAVVFEVIQETIGGIDEICSHHSIDEVYVGEVFVCDITHDRVILKAAGTIATELQWGSNSDVRNDMGAVISDSFPFECILSSPVSDMDEIGVEPDSLQVDTSKWHERDEEWGS